MLKEHDLCGVYVPVITPFEDSGELDLESFERHLRRLLAAGIHGVVINGTTGEAPTVRWEETEVLMAAARACMKGQKQWIPLVVGTGSNDTAAAVAKTARAGQLGADAVLVVVPYYSRPSQQGVIEHFRKVAEAGVPVILYEIPHRTGLALEPDTIRAILELDGVIGMKDSTKNTRLVSELARAGSKPVLCGEDTQWLAAMQCGAKGGMLASANVGTERFVQLFAHARAGNMAEAERGFAGLLPLIELLFAEPNPAPLKWLLARQQLIRSGALRLPMTPISEELGAKLAAFL